MTELMLKKIEHVKLWTGIAWAQAIVATAGSLYFSEIVGWTPCELCWYQRIFMYPLVVILGLAWWQGDKRVSYYAIPLAAIGGLISTYHYLMQWGIVQEGVCRVGSVSCTFVPERWLGFITLPLLALVAFVVIIACLVQVVRKS